MPKNRDMQLYHQLQAKIRQQEVDYDNMHTHSVIVRGPRGKEFVLDGDNQYHEALKRGDFNETDTVRNPVVTQFEPRNEDTPMSRAVDPSRASFNDVILPSPNRGATNQREHNLGSASDVQRRQTLFDQQMQEAHAEQKQEAPNMNVDPHLTQVTKTVGERVKQNKRTTRYKGSYKVGTGAGKAKRKGSKVKVKNAGYNTEKDTPRAVRLDEAEGDEAGRTGKRIGMTKPGKAMSKRYSQLGKK